MVLLLRSVDFDFSLVGNNISIMRSQYSTQMTSLGGEEIGQLSRKELDDANLARMGKRPVLKVDAV